MSKQEFSRLEVLLQVQSGRLRVADACELIGLHRRQVFRLLRGLKQDGATSLLSKRRGKPSNNRLPSEVRNLALSTVRDRYADFGPTLAGKRDTDGGTRTDGRKVLPSLSEVGAGCGKAARTDLCGGTGATRFPTAITEMPPATGGFLRDREIYSDAQGDGGLATTEPGSRKVRSAPGPSE